MFAFAKKVTNQLTNTVHISVLCVVIYDIKQQSTTQPFTSTQTNYTMGGASYYYTGQLPITIHCGGPCFVV